MQSELVWLAQCHTHQATNHLATNTTHVQWPPLPIVTARHLAAILTAHVTKSIETLRRQDQQLGPTDIAMAMVVRIFHLVEVTMLVHHLLGLEHQCQCQPTIDHMLLTCSLLRLVPEALRQAVLMVHLETSLVRHSVVILPSVVDHLAKPAMTITTRGMVWVQELEASLLAVEVATEAMIGAEVTWVMVGVVAAAGGMMMVMVVVATLAANQVMSHATVQIKIPTKSAVAEHATPVVNKAMCLATVRTKKLLKGAVGGAVVGVEVVGTRLVAMVAGMVVVSQVSATNSPRHSVCTITAAAPHILEHSASPPWLRFRRAANRSWMAASYFQQDSVLSKRSE